MASSIPHEALARAVRAAFGTAVEVVGHEPLAGDASSRRYVRLRLAGPDVPATVVAMLLPPEQRSDELGGGATAGELPFLNVGRYFAAIDLPVPRVHHAALADALLLLEDIGDTTLWKAVSGDPARVEPLFATAVDLLVRLQVAGVRRPDPGCRAFGIRFDGALARAEIAHYVDHGIETRHGIRLDPAERAELLAGLDPLCTPFETGAPVLSHRDYMAWNVHVQGERLVLIDFQDALMAPDAFDLSQLLTDRTTSTVVSPALEETLIARFLAARADAGLPVTGDFATRYRQCTLQHALKVIGRFYFLERVKGKPGYLAYLPAVYGVSRRMFDGLPELAAVRAHVARYTPELAP
jgi:aminoglycoside/choline kinase family phosphotransferase